MTSRIVYVAAGENVDGKQERTIMPFQEHCRAPHPDGRRWVAMQRIYRRDGTRWLPMGWICPYQHIKLDNPLETAAVMNQPELPGVRDA